MKITNTILTILFLLFAIVQYNDPDPLFWILIYSFVALICGMAIYCKYNTFLIGMGTGICLWGMLNLLPDFIHWIEIGSPNIASEMKTEEPHIELVREFLGYVICIAVLVFYYFQSRKEKVTPTTGN